MDINGKFDLILEKLSKIDTIDERLQRVEAKLEEHDKKFDIIFAKFDEYDKRFDVIDQKFAEIDKRFVEIDDRFDEIDERFDSKNVNVVFSQNLFLKYIKKYPIHWFSTSV